MLEWTGLLASKLPERVRAPTLPQQAGVSQLVWDDNIEASPRGVAVFAFNSSWRRCWQAQQSSIVLGPSLVAACSYPGREIRSMSAVTLPTEDPLLDHPRYQQVWRRLSWSCRCHTLQDWLRPEKSYAIECARRLGWWVRGPSVLCPRCWTRRLAKWSPASSWRGGSGCALVLEH